jgi:DNA-binding CsgD family transcriptional regulator
MQALEERKRLVTVSFYTAWRDAVLAVVDGQLEDALTLAVRFVERAEESGAPVRGRYYGLHLLFVPALWLGRAEDWLSSFEKYAGQAPPAEQAPVFIALTARRAICLADLGHLDEARAVAGPLLDRAATHWDGSQAIHALASLLEAAIALEYRDAAQRLAERLVCVAHLPNADHFYTCIGRQLGNAAQLVGDRKAARTYYLQALESAGKIRFRPELALTHVSVAELLHTEGDESAALEHLDLAIPELRDMKMQPALERGLSLLEQVRHRTPVPASDAHAPHALTGRERDVPRLLAAGQSNREIADALVITEGTVEVHVKHILSKLGLRSRAQVAAWASDERL